MNYQEYITIDANKPGGKPCVRGLRITVYEVLDYLASDMGFCGGAQLTKVFKLPTLMNFSGKVFSQKAHPQRSKPLKRFTAFCRAQVTGLKPRCE